MNRAWAAVVASLFLAAPAAAGCPVLPLHVAAGSSLPPVFATTLGVSFPHVRLPATPAEIYRAGDATGADSASVTLYAVKGPGASELTLIVELPCAPLPSFADTGVTLRDLHIAVTGTAGGDGSAARPFDTLARAAGAARAGDRLLIHEGSYPGSAFISDLTGTALNPIVISGVPGEAPPVLGSTAVAEAIHLTDPAYVVLQDLVVAGPTGNGINMDDGGDYTTPAHHVVVRRVTIRDIGTGGNQDCLKLSGLDDFLVVASDLQRCGAGGSGVDMVGCHDGLIESNVFRNSGANAIQAKGGSADVVVRGNLMVDAGPRAMNLGGSTGLAFFRPLDADYEARNIQALSNVVVGSDAPTAYVGCDACLVANNTFYLPTRWVTRILQETTDARFVRCRAGRFSNNIVVFDSASLSTFVNIGPETLPATFVFSNNLWFSRDDPSFRGPTLPVVETDPVIQRDPRLVDPVAEDFHVLLGSPAVDAGTCVPEVSYDRDAVCYGTPPSLGAYELP